MEKEITVREVLDEYQLILPGENIAKTTGYFIFPLLVLFLITDNPIFTAGIDRLSPHQKFSFIFLLLSLVTSVISGWCAHFVTRSNIKDIQKYSSLFYGKILIEISVIFFYLVICWWVILLGGIITSPFAALLSMSPILLLVQFFRDRNQEYDKFYNTIKEKWESLHKNQQIKSHNFIKRTIIVLSSIPLILVVLTLSIGQYISSHFPILPNDIDVIISSHWYVTVYHCIYYISVFIAIFGILPQHQLQIITRKIF